MRKYEIVCVDDEEVILELYASSLEEMGYEIITFINPVEALDYIITNKGKIVSIVSDYKMPEMTGLELREKIISNDIYIPFFMITGFYNKEMAVKGMELKVSRFIQKPFDHQALSESVKDDCQRYQSHLDEEFEMISSFVDESSPMLDEIEELILQLEDTPNDINCLNTYFRLLHTIKGTASCVGLVSLPEFTHNYEDLVGNLKHGDIKVNNQIIDILLKGLDVLKRMYNDISEGRSFEFDIKEDIKIFDLSQLKIEEDQDNEEEKTVANKGKKVEDEKLGIQVSLLDNFMELSGEMTVLRNMILKSVSKIEGKYQGDRDVDVLSDTLDEMHKVSSRLQNQISEMRKVTISSIYRPLKRVVRDASKKLSKDVDLILEGDELRVDTSVGKVLSNALVHLVRNGIDHGIETIEKRKEIGKESQGTLQIKTSIDGENIIVAVIDDGNGIDKDRLKEKAIEKDLYSEDELNKMSDHKVLSLIFDSGFSTASEVTDISGRGVGMDMVKSSIESIRGKITIDSTLGEGTTFYMSIPIPRSVLIINSLMVSICNDQYAIPLDSVAEVIDVNKARNELEEVANGLVLNHGDLLLPIVDIRDDFVNGHSCGLTDTSIVVLKHESFHYGLIVEKVMDIEEVVVKKLVKKLDHKDVIFEGVTLVGDGEMALIFDLERLAIFTGVNLREVRDDLDEFIQQSSNIIHSEYIRVNINGDDRFCISLDSVDRLEEFETSKISFSGDIPIYRYRDSFLPLVDLFIKSDDFIFTNKEEFKVLVLTKNDQKIGLIVTEINDIVSTAETIDKMFHNQKEILGTIYINEQTLNVLDDQFIFDNYKEIYKEKPITNNTDDEISQAA